VNGLEIPLLFYSPGSCSTAEIILFEWVREPYRLCRVTGEERRGEVYRSAVNPLGQVPTLRLEDGRLLTENASLLLLIAERHPERRLVPEPGTPERYELYRRLSWLNSGFHAAHYPFFFPGRYVPDESLYDTVREHSSRGIRAALGTLDRQLAGKRHVFLDRPTVLDPYVFAIARWSRRRFDYPTEFPHVEAFLQRMERDEAVRFALAVERREIVMPVSPQAPFRGHVALIDVAGETT
jgi:glutathione S-transferase